MVVMPGHLHIEAMKRKQIEPERFSTHYGLKKDQTKLDFVDIYAYQDIPLFLDPYGISVMETDWSKKCEQHIATYFQYLIDRIKNNDKRTTQKLLNALHEVDEVALGYSSGSPSGRGIGREQADLLKKAFENSQAAKSGDIRDIADCALLIPGINRDKVSDITANILKNDLIEFTHTQCKLHGIPMNRVAVNNAFDFERFEFKSFYTRLPVINGKPKILLPISSVRRQPELSKEKYYRNFILEYLRAEHTHAGDSLAYVLKNGSLKVNIKDLKERYPMSVDFIYKFSTDHPQILKKFKTELVKTAKKPGATPKLNPKPKVLTTDERIRIISDLKPGNEDAYNFHKISFDSLIHIFGRRLSNPVMENPRHEGRKRIDITFDNSDTIGFFHTLNSLHHIFCPKIMVECKNYGREIYNPELDQLQGRFGNRTGQFGILVCRSIQNRKSLLLKCKDTMNDNRGIILVLDDSDISMLLKLKGDKNEKGIDDFMNKKLDQLIM